MKLLYSWMYLYHSPTDSHYLWPHIYICKFILCQQEALSGELEVSPVTLYTKVPSEIQWYKNTRTGFRFWNMQSSTKHSPHPPTIQISLGRIYFCDITNTGKQRCSPNEPFVVVLEKGFFFLNEISPFGVDFEICNFVDLFMPKHTHYTLTKIQKVKSIIGPL